MVIDFFNGIFGVALTAKARYYLAKLFMVGALALGFPAIVTAADNTLTPEEIADGWILLFDGETTNGWHTLGQPDNDVFKAWTVSNGSLKFKKTSNVHPYFWICCQRNRRAGGGNIATNNRKFSNFHVKVDWKLNDNTNSGLIMFADEEYYKRHRAPWKPFVYGGLESQIVDEDVGVNSINKALTGDLYDFVRVPEDIDKKLNPPGQWNTTEVVVTSTRFVNVILNGQTVIQAADLNDFKDRLKIPSSIMLQDHGQEIEFKNIKIKPM